MTIDAPRHEATGSPHGARGPDRRPWRVRTPIIGAALVLLAGTLGAGFARWTVTDAGLRARVLGTVERASGLRVVQAGPLAIRLLPAPSVSVRDVAIRGADGAVALEADAMSGRLGLSALWGEIGRAHV